MKSLRNVIFIILLISIIIFVLQILVYKIKTNNYKAITATITNVRVDETDNMGNPIMNYASYTTYSYKVNNKLYEVELPTYNSKEIGKKEKIRYNPNNPKEIYNKYYINSIIIITLFQIFIEICLFIVIKNPSYQQ